MGISRKLSLALSTLTMLIVAPSFMSAQSTSEEETVRKLLSCGVFSHLSGFGDSCGFDYYDAAFVARIISTKELPGNEFQLVVSPTEIFKGDLPDIVTLTTRSGACLPEFVIG